LIAITVSFVHGLETPGGRRGSLRNIHPTHTPHGYQAVGCRVNPGTDAGFPAAVKACQRLAAALG